MDVDGPSGSSSHEPTLSEPRGEELRWSCRVEPLGGTRYALRLAGSLHVSWAGRLAAGLAARNVSVVRVRAQRGPTAWTADVVIDLLDPRVEPSAIDFIALMQDDPPPERTADAVTLASCAVTAGPRGLVVELRAQDSVGFLERVLRLFAMDALYAHEMRVDTRAGEVHDVFGLRNLTGRAPSPVVAAALRRRLEALVAR